jgi:hypothetical protein
LSESEPADLRPRPVACTLSAADLHERSAAWDRLLESGQVRRTRVRGGLQLKPEPTAVKTLMRLIVLERECCPWIDFEVGDDSTVTLTAEGDGEAVLSGMFVGTA